MLTWINEKAKWIIVIAAVGIALGLLAMDNIPDQAVRAPLGVVNGRKITAEEFELRVRNFSANQDTKNYDDERYAMLRADIFKSFVRQYVLEERVSENGLGASVAEMKYELLSNPNTVRGLIGNEAQQRIYAIQSQGTNVDETNQRIQAYLATIPTFLMDSSLDTAAYEQWLNTPAAYEWANMVRYEQELKTNTVPMRQLQTFVSAGVHPTSLEASYATKRRLEEYDLQVAHVPGNLFASKIPEVDSAAVKAYFDASPDSFYVEEDMMQVQYAKLEIAPSAKDEAALHDYAMTLYNQLIDSSATFEDLAKISSEDPGSAEKGGLLGDYTARGAWVKPFEDAAFALDSGAISEPVRSQFGFHIIKSLGKIVDEDSTEKVKAAHILITVTASSETEDSLSQILTSIRDAVEAGQSFAEAAKAKGLEVETSPWLKRGGSIPELGYLQGLSSFLFVNKNSSEPQGKVSGALKNKKFAAIVFKSDSLVAGKRNLAPHFETIKRTLRERAMAEAARAYLDSVSAQVKAWNAGDSIKPEIPNVSLETEHASVDGYVPGLGYGNSLLSGVVKTQKVGEWGPAFVTETGAAMVRVEAAKKASDEALEKAVKEEIANDYRFSVSSVASEYVNNLESSAKITNNLDLYYKD